VVEKAKRAFRSRRFYDVLGEKVQELW